MTTTKPNDPGAYILKVREGTQRYANELLADNEHLRALVVTMKTERTVLDADLKDARESLVRHRVLELQLADKLRGIEADTQKARERFAEIEHQNTNLASLYVASHRLHGTLERVEVLAAIREIVANLIGSEEMGLFGVVPGAATLELVDNNGLDAARYAAVPSDRGILGRVASTGRTHITDIDGLHGASEFDECLTAAVPLRAGDRIIGVIGIFRMLPQKPRIAPVDHELFELLAAQAGMALLCTEMHQRLATGAAARA